MLVVHFWRSLYSLYKQGTLGYVLEAGYLLKYVLYVSYRQRSLW